MKQLGQLETAVMQRLWDWDRPVPVRDVLEDLQREREIAYTTVMTVLDNLHGKGFARREKVGRAYYYRATMTREEHTASLLEQVLSAGADREATLLHFVGQMSTAEISGLRAALASLDQDST